MKLVLKGYILYDSNHMTSEKDKLIETEKNISSYHMFGGRGVKGWAARAQWIFYGIETPLYDTVMWIHYIMLS